MRNNKRTVLFILGLVLITAGVAISIGLIRRTETIAHGCFHQVAHTGSGCAFLIRRPDDTILLQLKDFETAESPGLHVLLISAADANENETVKSSDRIYVGPLQRFTGDQEYELSAYENLENFRSVTIWNSKYGVNFTTAPLRQDEP